MSIADVLRHKHDPAVATIDPTETVTTLLATLADRNVGALVVTERGAVVGIVSERDVVRRLAASGADVLTAPVASIMTTSVVTCSGEDAIEQIATTMTQRRIRHMPVVDGGRLVGIVSIGDVVSSRIRELEHVRGQLEQYIAG